MGEYFSWMTGGIALAAGASVGLLFWWALSVVDAVPPDDRRYRDRPPRAIEILKGPIRILAFHLGSILPLAWVAWLDKRLKMAGASQAVTAQEMAACCVLSGILLTLVFGLPLAFIGAYSDWVALVTLTLGFFYPVWWLRDTILKRHRTMLRQLPDFLDVVTLSLESGRNVQSALREALEKSPAGPLSEEFRRALAELETGSSWPDALEHLAGRVKSPPVSTVVAAISNAHRSGATLGPTMRAQADQSRMERFARAETLAMQAPVKLLGPLMICFFPCTLVILGFLIVPKLFNLVL